MFSPRTIIEPFRIKTVEAIRLPTQVDRELALARAHFNLFGLRADEVLIDLLTDSGTGAMSAEQVSAMMRGDESYAGSRSFARFEESVREVTGYTHVLPTHQGRAAERILFEMFCSSGQVVISNTLFDTTRANVEVRGGSGIDLPIPEGRTPSAEHPFKGNIDLAALEKKITELGREKIALVLLTVTNNSGGGQPVSLENIRSASSLCRKHGLRIYLDACRFAENAWFIKTREAGQSDRTVAEIAAEMFSLVDGCTMSAKKDGLSNIGGFLAFKDIDERSLLRARDLLILSEGFPSYGGLAGYDLEAVAVGLKEALSEDYLRYRVRSIEYLAERLHARGIPTLRPPGGHAVYLDAGAALSHIPKSQFPGQVLSVELYRVAGVRSVEIGSAMFGKHAAHELVRLTFPRRTYTQSHVDYLLEAIEYVFSHRNSLRGLTMIYEAPSLRHFTARYAWV